MEELEPVKTEAGLSRRLKVTFPSYIHSHCPEQVFHVNDAGLLTRMDYAAEATNSGPVAHLMMEHKTYDGIVVPTHRKAYFLGPDGSVIRDHVPVEVKTRNVEILFK